MIREILHWTHLNMPAFDWEKAVFLSLVVKDWVLSTPKVTIEPKIPKTDQISNIASYCPMSQYVSITMYPQWNPFYQLLTGWFSSWEWMNEPRRDWHIKVLSPPVSAREFYLLLFLSLDQLLIAERAYFPTLLLAICRVGLSSSSERATPYSAYLNWSDSAASCTAHLSQQFVQMPL